MINPGFCKAKSARRAAGLNLIEIQRFRRDNPILDFFFYKENQGWCQLHLKIQESWPNILLERFCARLLSACKIWDNFWRRFFFLRSLQPHDRKKVQFLFELYQKLDNDIASFQKSSRLKCREGCGQCCENPKVTTSILELLPVAFHLWQNNQAQGWLDEVKTRNDSGSCVFYKKDSRKPGMGRCSIYHFRPLICRLFGFSAKSDKHGKKQLLTCPIIKETYAKTILDMETHSTLVKLIPKATDYTMRLQGLDPALSQELPVNEAILKALEKAGLTFQYKK